MHGKGDKIWHLPLHPATVEHIDAYLQIVEHGSDRQGPGVAWLREYCDDLDLRSTQNASGAQSDVQGNVLIAIDGRHSG